MIQRYRTQRTGALLAYLALHLQRTHPREELVERFWPESDPDAGRMCLRAALSSLRRQLEPPGCASGQILVADRVNVRLDPAAVSVDVLEFEQALAAVARQTEPAERIARLERAIGLHQGELLPGCYEDWVFQERERLKGACRKALQQLASLLEEQGELARAIDCRYRAVALDVLDEAAHQELIRLLLTAGDASAAVRQYRRLEELLRRELGTEPEAKTRALVSGLAGALAHGAPPPASPPISARVRLEYRTPQALAPPPAPVPAVGAVSGYVPVQVVSESRPA